MRAVVQRVSRARVVVDGRTTGEIESGLVALVAVGREDAAGDGDVDGGEGREPAHLQ